MSKRLWCGLYAVSVSLLIILMIVGAVVGMLTADEVLQPGYLGGAIGLLAIGYLQFIVIHTVATLVLLYNLWKALEDGVTPVTAGKAIVFLFIPFFNIYWFFRVWGGYPPEYNRFLERNRLGAPPLGSGIFIAFAVTVGLSAVLLIPILALPVVTVFLIARDGMPSPTFSSRNPLPPATEPCHLRTSSERRKTRGRRCRPSPLLGSRPLRS